MYNYYLIQAVKMCAAPKKAMVKNVKFWVAAKTWF